MNEELSSSLAECINLEEVRNSSLPSVRTDLPILDMIKSLNNYFKAYEVDYSEFHVPYPIENSLNAMTSIRYWQPGSGRPIDGILSSSCCFSFPRR